MTGVEGRNVACSVKRCDETGAHTVHRLYLGSIPAESGRWMLGVNVIRP